MERITAKQELLERCFNGHYTLNLPEDDKGMFCLIVGLGMSRSISKMINQIRDFEEIAIEMVNNKNSAYSNLTRKTLKTVDKSRNKFFNRAENSMKKYICEVKGFKKGWKSEPYVNWFHDMSQKFEKDKESWTVLIKIYMEYVSQISKEILLESFKVA